MDQNSQIVGVSAKLDLGIPRSSRAGKVLHPLLVGKRAVLGSGAQVPVRMAAVVAVPLALWLGMNSSDFMQQAFSSASLHASNLGTSQEDKKPQAAPKTAVAAKPNHPVVVASSERPNPEVAGQTKPQLSPLPGMPMPGGVAGMPTPYHVPANAEFVNPSQIASRHVQSVEVAPSKNGSATQAEKQKPSSMLVMDISGGDQRNDAPQSASPTTESDPAVQKAEPAKTQVASAEQLPAKEQRNEVAAPSVKLPSLKDAPTETKKAKDTKDTKPVEVESMSVAKAEPAKLKAVQVKEPQAPKKQTVKQAQQHEDPPPKAPKKSSSKSDGKLFDEGDSGFAEPIRTRSFGGQQEQTRQPAARSNRGGAVEVIDVTNNSVIITNPKTNLPMQVRVGGKLPNGEVVTKVDKQSGAVQTSGGVLRAD